MAKSKAKQREAVAATRVVRAEPEAVSAASFIVSLLMGALAADVVLLFLSFGLREIWSPFALTGDRVWRALAFSGLIGGLVTAIAARGARGPQAPAACALGWGIWGLLQHVVAPGGLKSLPFIVKMPAAQLPSVATAVILNTGAFQPLCIAFGLLLAAVTARMTDRLIFAPHRATVVSAKAPQMGANRSRAIVRVMTYPLLTMVLGLVLISLLGLLLLLPPQLHARDLPLHVSRAWLCAVVSLSASAVAAYVIRSFWRPTGSLGYLLAAPLVIAFASAMIIVTQGKLPLLEPMKRLLWNSSAFELASWGAFGAACGYWAAETSDESRVMSDEGERS